MKNRILFVAALLILPQFGHSKVLERSLAQTAVSAVVKVGAIDANGRPVGSGSGTMIDPRGYVPTNFHVVGNKKTGQLINKDNKVLLGLVTSSRESVRYRWEGTVVRSDPRLDLALVRILKDTMGKPVGDRTFPTLQVASTRDLEPGSPVWVVGFPAGVRSVNMTAGTIAGFEMNVIKQVSWLRTDAEINPGNSGGQLIDEKGRLVGIPTQVRVADRRRVVETIGFARPAERIPAEWIKAIKSGHITDTKTIGQFELPIGKGLHDRVVGDYMALSGAERRFYVVPKERPGTIQISDKSISVALLRKNMRLLRAGQSELEVKKNDPHPLILSMIFPQKDLTAPKSFWVLFQKQDAVMADLAELEKGLSELDIPGVDESKKKPAVLLNRKASATGGVVVKGRVVDAISGKGIFGMTLVGKPGVDVKETVTSVKAGKISKSEFRKRVIFFPISRSSGFTARLASGQKAYQIFVGSRGYRPHFMTITPKAGQSSFDLGTIKLVK